MRILSIVAVCLLLAASAAGMMMGGGVEIAASNSALYTAATAIWDFESGAFASDTKGTHTLTDNNSVGTGSTDPPQGSQYATFNGTDEYFSLADHSDFDFGTSNDWSISFWIRDSSWDTMHILAKADTGYVNGYLLRFYPYSNYEPRIYTYDGGNASSSEANGATPSADTWYHVVITYDTSESEFTIWMSSDGGTFGDETNADTTTSVSYEADANSEAFQVGMWNSSYSSFSIDELVIFKGKELSAAEAESIYDANGGSSWR